MVLLSVEAENFLRKCDKPVRKRILDKLTELRDDPDLGKPLAGVLTGKRSLRIGDYRAVYQIKMNELAVLVIKIGHRKKIYT